MPGMRTWRVIGGPGFGKWPMIEMCEGEFQFLPEDVE